MLTSQVGTLVTCQNGYVNEGGEVVKRSKFELVESLLILDTFDNTATFFGFVTLPTGGQTFEIELYGHALPYGAAAEQGQPTLVSSVASFDSTVNYHQLKHPLLVNLSTATFDNDKHVISKILFADLYNDKGLVLAEFIDGGKYLYYDDELVQHTANGLVLAGGTALTTLSSDLARQIEELGWVSVANTNESGVTQNGSTIVSSPVANAFGASIELVSDGGLVGYKSIAQYGTTTTAVKGTVTFEITNETGTFTLEAPTEKSGISVTSITRSGATATATIANHSFVVGQRIMIVGATQPEYNGFFSVATITTSTFTFTVTGTPATPATGTITVLDTVEISGGAVADAGTATQTAEAIVAAVNDYTSAHGYIAANNAQFVTVSAPNGWGIDVVLSLNVIVTTGSVTSGATTPSTVTATFSASSTYTYNFGVNYVVVETNNNFATLLSVNLTLTPTGGTIPYTYDWTLVQPNDMSFLGSTKQATVTVRRAMTVKGAYEAAVKCMIRDTSGFVLTKIITVTFIRRN